MNLKFCFLFGIILLFFSSHCTPKLDKFYSTAFLKDYQAVRSSLKNIGFEKITFKTSDHLKLAGLFLSRPNATCNVIICAGWLPGRKEGMATFYALLPEYCNILFFDARGRGQSEGPLFWKIWCYGIDEYKDIIGAIDWINNNNQLPIIMGGTCSGVFNAAHAIIQLKKNNKLVQSQVKGLFFDSGWGSVLTMSQSSAIANIKKYLTRKLAILCRTKKEIEQHIIYKACSSIIFSGFKIVHTLCALPVIMYYEKTTNLFDKIHHITIPIFFIHSYDDTHADINNAIKLTTSAPHCHCWWIEKSSHAKHHIIHKDLYKEKLIAFIDTVIQQ